MTVFVPVTREAQPRLYDYVSFGCSNLRSSSLPVCRLPGKQERRRKHCVRIVLSKVGDAVVQSLESKACVMECKVSGFGRLRDPRQMRGRECEDAVHNEWMGRGYAQESTHVSGSSGHCRLGCLVRTWASCRSKE
jgi:hypothetical protein